MSFRVCSISGLSSGMTLYIARHLKAECLSISMYVKYFRTLMYKESRHRDNTFISSAISNNGIIQNRGNSQKNRI